jgi:hypothetical protein
MTDDKKPGMPLVPLPASVEELEWSVRVEEYRDSHNGATDFSDQEIMQILVLADNMRRFDERMMAMARAAGLKTRKEREEEAALKRKEEERRAKE